MPTDRRMHASTTIQLGQTESRSSSTNQVVEHTHETSRFRSSSELQLAGSLGDDFTKLLLLEGRNRRLGRGGAILKCRDRIRVLSGSLTTDASQRRTQRTHVCSSRTQRVLIGTSHYLVRMHILTTCTCAYISTDLVNDSMAAILFFERIPVVVCSDLELPRHLRTILDMP